MNAVINKFREVEAPYTIIQTFNNGAITKIFYWKISELKKDLTNFRITQVGRLEKIVVKRKEFIIDEIAIAKSKEDLEKIQIELVRLSMADVSKETKSILITEADYFRCADNIEAYLISKDVVKTCYNRTQNSTIINETAKILTSMKDNSYLMFYNPSDAH